MTKRFLEEARDQTERLCFPLSSLKLFVFEMLRAGFVPFFRNKFPGLRLIFLDSKIHINPFTPKISMLILLTVCHTFHIFQNFSVPVDFFQDFAVLENDTTKFQDFPDFPGPVQTLGPIKISNFVVDTRIMKWWWWWWSSWRSWWWWWW